MVDGVGSSKARFIVVVGGIDEENCTDLNETIIFFV